VALTRRQLLPRAQLKSDFRTRRERQQGVLESGVPVAVPQGQVEEGMPWRQ
jgi:hypothetical protein